MSDGMGEAALPGVPNTRRELVVSSLLALGGLFMHSKVEGSEQAKTESGPGVKDTRTSLHQEIDLHASPERIYETLLDSKQFAAFSGQPAEIHREVGGAFSTFGRQITGRNVELIPNQRIVQAWRVAAWEPGVYSIVRFELKAQGAQTTLVLDHTGFGEGMFEHLDPGWKVRYWDPLRKFLG